MTTQKKPGFGGQWIEIFSAGPHVGKADDGSDVPGNYDVAFCEAAARNYDPTLHEAPVTIGHPAHDAPAYGWISAARVNDGKLEVQFADTDPTFEQMVRDGRLKKRSPKFYVDASAPGGKAPYIRHVAFLGAMPPVVKGLKDIHFSETEGKTVAFEVEFSEGDGMSTSETQISEEQITGAVQGFFKKHFPNLFKSAESASFSEADAKKLIDDAVKAAVDPLKTQITSLETENKDLKTQVAGIGTNTTRGELVSFCESLETAGTLPRSFRNMGGVEFLETVASLPPEKKVKTVEFAEETVNGEKKQVEKKTEIAPLDFMKKFLSSMRYVQFGEAFADARPSGDGSDLVNPARMKTMQEAAGLPSEAKS